jgi:hypothetical protein
MHEAEPRRTRKQTSRCRSSSAQVVPSASRMRNAWPSGRVVRDRIHFIQKCGGRDRQASLWTERSGCFVSVTKSGDHDPAAVRQWRLAVASVAR